MSLPANKSKIWADLITGSKVVEFEFLAIKIYLGTAQRHYKENPQSLEKSALGLYEVFFKNQNLPTAQKDIAKLG